MLYRSECHFRHDNERIGIVSFFLHSGPDLRLQGFAAQRVIQSNSNLIFCAVCEELFHFCQYNLRIKLMENIFKDVVFYTGLLGTVIVILA